MSDIGKSALKNLIDSAVTDNESGLITGTVMNGVLQDAVDTLANGENLDAGSVKTANIADGAIATAKVADGAITEGKIGTGAVTSGKIGDGAVTAAKIGSKAVETAKLDDAAVTGAKIADGAVTADKVGSGAVTAGKIGAKAVTTAKLDDAAVTTAKVDDSAITTVKIANGNVTTAKIADGAVTVDKIGAAAVSTAKIADGAVTADKIGAGALATAKIADGAVTTAKVADGAINSDKLAAGAVTTNKIYDGNVTGAKIADSTITSGKIASGAVETGNIKNKAVTSAKINDGAVGTDQIADNAVTTAKIANDAVTTVKINNGAVTTAKIADEGVTTAKIADGNVTTAKISDSNVTTAKIADENITTGKIADEAVTTAKIADDAVTTDKVADGAITDAKLQNPVSVSQNTLTTENKAKAISVGGTDYNVTDADAQEKISQLEQKVNEVDSVPMTGSDKLVDSKGVAKFIGDYVPVNRTLMTPFSNITGWALLANGLSTPNQDSKIVKYQVIEGAFLELNLKKDNAGVYQFQNNSSVPASGTNTSLVGNTITNASNGIVQVPSGATYLIVSQFITNETNSIYKCNNTIDSKPTRGSKNLVESGGILMSEKEEAVKMANIDTTCTIQKTDTGYLTWGDNGIELTSNTSVGIQRDFYIRNIISFDANHNYVMEILWHRKDESSDTFGRVTYGKQIEQIITPAQRNTYDRVRLRLWKSDSSFITDEDVAAFNVTVKTVSDSYLELKVPNPIGYLAAVSSSTELYTDTENSVIKTTGPFVDLYTNTGFYKRINQNEFSIPLTTGTSILYFNPTTNVFDWGSAAIRNDGELIICGFRDAVCGIYHINGFMPIIASNGEKYKLYSDKEIVDLITNTFTAVPEFVNSACLATKKRIIDYCDDSPSYCIGQITDVHTSGSSRYLHVGYLDKMSSMLGLNLIVNSGDIGLDTNSTTENRDNALSLIANTKAQMSDCNPWVFCKGNHERLEGNELIGNTFNRPFRNAHYEIVYGDNNATYGYVRDRSIGITTFFLNTTDNVSPDVEHYVMQSAQIHWLAAYLQSIKSNNERLVFLTHVCLNIIGSWQSTIDRGSDTSERVRDLKNLLNAVQEKTSYTYNGITYDYSNNNLTIVCCLSGDSHFDNQVKLENGLNIIVRQGYGYMDSSELQQGAVYTPFNPSEECLFDILVIKDNIAKIFRVGAGGSSRDYEFTF